VTGLPPWVYTFVIVIVTVIWSALNVADALSAAYAVPAQVQVTMGIVAGAALGGQVVVTKRREGD
jgi:hypothetical protein